MKLNDLAGLSKPITKFIKVVSNGIGTLYSSTLIRKNADAKAYEIKTISKAIEETKENFSSCEYVDGKIKLISEKTDTHYPEVLLPDRTESRIQFQEFNKQLNIENIIQKALGQIANETEVSDEEVDKDWSTRFFNYAADISNEEMQNLWAQILAGEVKQPKSYSLRTLELLRNLSKEEAETFLEIANFAITVNYDSFIVKGQVIEKFGCDLHKFSIMRELNIINSTDYLNYDFHSEHTGYSSYMIFGKKVLVVSKLGQSPTQSLSVESFTSIGKELLGLIKINPPFEYLKEVASLLQSDKTSVKYGDFLGVNLDNTISHSTPLKDII